MPRTATEAIEMRIRMFPQRMDIISGATETMERRMKMYPENTITKSKATGTKATRWEMRMSLMRSNSQSRFSKPMGTKAL